MCAKHRLAHTKELFKSEEVLPFNELVKYNQLLFMYDYVNFRLPETFDGTWLTNWQNNPDVQYDLRNANDFKIKRTRYVYLEDHPLYLLPRQWNDLISEFKEIGSRSLFISKIKHDLLSKINF